MPSVNILETNHDLSDGDLDYLMNHVATASGFTRPLILEIRRHRAMVKRIEDLAINLEHDSHPVAAELRNRMRTP